MAGDKITIEGESWEAEMTKVEYGEWCIYADAHPWLFQGISYEGVLNMFLFNYRMGYNPNKPLTK